MTFAFRLAGAALALAASTGSVHAQDFTVTSISFTGGRLQPAQFANGFGCSGGNVSPQIAWKGAPQGTKSFAVTIYDPDAPTGSGWWHWVVANIPATVSELAAGAGSGALPPGAIQVRGDDGRPGYLGACPPPGQTHHYVVTVNALKVDKLDLPPEVTPAMLAFMMLDASLAKATLTATGSR